MSIKLPIIGTTLAALAISVAGTAPASAGLGGWSDSVAADSHVLRGQVQSTAYLQYDVQQISSGALVIHEYLNRAGQVFAISWQGPTPPDLQQLLGSYFGQLQAAAAAQHRLDPGIHRILEISTPDLVVQSAGRLRDFHGLAYLPALVPAGVVPGDLQ